MYVVAQKTSHKTVTQLISSMGYWRVFLWYKNAALLTATVERKSMFAYHFIEQIETTSSGYLVAWHLGKYSLLSLSTEENGLSRNIF